MSSQSVGFLVLTASLVVSWSVVAPWKRFLRRGPAVSRDVHPYEVACLREADDARKRLLPAVLGALRVDQVLGLAGRGVRVAGPARRRLVPVEDAVVAAVAARPEGAVLGAIADDERVTSAVDGLRARLLEDGLVLAPRARRRLRLAYLFLWVVSTGPVIVYGYLAGWTEAEKITPAEAWIFVPIVWWFVTFFWAAFRVLDPEHTTKAADRAVAAVASRHRALRRRVRRHEDLPVSAEEAALLIALGADRIPGVEHEFALRARIYVPTGDG
ncbi:TIGR04222 domain-containing membrane protein [Spirillospora sp. CA-294931]|uniref:TIGR04222 domain-containing membrane protein n=1 Tax=Spirillospora sp. CA-294931 TaxID=3240042 RepID=UPI003D8FC1D2